MKFFGIFIILKICFRAGVFAGKQGSNLKSRESRMIDYRTVTASVSRCAWLYQRLYLRNQNTRRLLRKVTKTEKYRSG